MGICWLFSISLFQLLLWEILFWAPRVLIQIVCLCRLPGFPLREAIEAANQTFGHDTITFDSSLDGTTIALLDALGELSITEGVTIDTEGKDITIDAGHGPDNISGNGDGFRVFNFELSYDSDFTLRGLTITGGDVDGHGGAISLRPDGATSILLEDLVVEDNHATADGGGIYFSGSSLEGDSLTIKDSTITDNTARDGGGLHTTVFNPSSFFNLNRSTISGNKAVSRGGGIFASARDSTGTMTDLTVTDNEAGLTLPETDADIPNSGGGIYAYLFASSFPSGSLTIARSEVSDNRAGEHGGGIAVCAKSVSEEVLTLNLLNMTCRHSYFALAA